MNWHLGKKVHTIHRNGLNQFEGQSTGSQGWFKLNIEFLKTTYSRRNSEFYKELFKENIEYQDTEVHTMFVVQFDKELINRKNEEPKPHLISQPDAPAP